MLWDTAQTSALGTAPAAKFWLALEQNGPWGARAATQSHLDPELGAALERRCQDAGGRFILIRRPGSHADPAEARRHHPPETRPQRVFVAGGLAGLPWLLEADLDDPARLVGLPWPDLAGGDADAVHQAFPELVSSPAPVLMICSNSRRDTCCAVRGRPVALESASQRPGQVWECSHTGGHRFAPTGVLLPQGQMFGRLSGASAVAAVDAAAHGEVPAQLWGATYDRGRSYLSAPGQAAESVVRQQIREPLLLALSTTVTQQPADDDAGNADRTWRCRVSHVDGRRWDVIAIRRSGGEDLPESCGKASVPIWQWSVLNGSGR